MKIALNLKVRCYHLCLSGKGSWNSLIVHLSKGRVISGNVELMYFDIIFERLIDLLKMKQLSSLEEQYFLASSSGVAGSMFSIRAIGLLKTGQIKEKQEKSSSPDRWKTGVVEKLKFR